jgi:hypothetical protein
LSSEKKKGKEKGGLWGDRAKRKIKKSLSIFFFNRFLHSPKNPKKKKISFLERDF